MKPSLKPDLTYRLAHTVPESKTVPYTYPESRVIAAMLRVFAAGFMIVLIEWACTELLAGHLDAGEGGVGVHVDMSHLAATPPGLTVTVDAECVEASVSALPATSRPTTASTLSAKAVTNATSSHGTNSRCGSRRSPRRLLLGLRNG